MKLTFVYDSEFLNCFRLSSNTTSTSCMNSADYPYLELLLIYETRVTDLKLMFVIKFSFIVTFCHLRFACWSV